MLGRFDLLESIYLTATSAPQLGHDRCPDRLLIIISADRATTRWWSTSSNIQIRQRRECESRSVQAFHGRLCNWVTTGWSQQLSKTIEKSADREKRWETVKLLSGFLPPPLWQLAIEVLLSCRRIGGSPPEYGKWVVMIAVRSIICGAELIRFGSF